MTICGTALEPIPESADSASDPGTEAATHDRMPSEAELSQLIAILERHQTKEFKSFISSQKQALSSSAQRWAGRAGLTRGERDWRFAKARSRAADSLLQDQDRAFSCIPSAHTRSYCLPTLSLRKSTLGSRLPLILLVRSMKPRRRHRALRMSGVRTACHSGAPRVIV
jgi:hypothetical protein